jgi:class 3 adenylate cyclase
MGIEEDDFYYDGFPIIGCLSYNPDELLLTNSCTATENVGIDEVSFSNLPPQNYCISYIDIIDSTITTAKLASHTEVAKYYAIFLNSMAMIIRNFGAKIIKNAGDCLIYYFPRTSEPNNELAFKDVIECGITMISAHHIINARLYENKLPPLNFRISADYGKLSIANIASSASQDLFGSSMNICSKINSRAENNSIVIGQGLYQNLHDDDYIMKEVDKYGQYSVYSVTCKQERKILNPFKRTSSLKS